MGQEIPPEPPDYDDGKFYAAHMDKYQFILTDPFSCGYHIGKCVGCVTGLALNGYITLELDCQWMTSLCAGEPMEPCRLFDVTGPYDTMQDCVDAEY